MIRHKDEKEPIRFLFSLYEKKMYHIAFEILNDAQLAEDAVMNAFVKLLEHKYPIDDPLSDSSKRLAIFAARSAAIDLYRKNARERDRFSLTDDPAALMSSGSAASGANSSASPGSDISDLVEDLPPKYREVLFLRYYQENTTSEIAVKLGISEAAVRKRHERALRILREKKKTEGGLYEKQFKTI